MAEHPSKDTLSFKLSGKVSPGCRYAIVSWKPGGAAKRRLVSCHRRIKPARRQLAIHQQLRAKQTAKPGKLGNFLRMRPRNFAIFDLMSGKKVKS